MDLKVGAFISCKWGFLKIWGKKSRYWKSNERLCKTVMSRITLCDISIHNLEDLEVLRKKEILYKVMYNKKTHQQS